MGTTATAAAEEGSSAMSSEAYPSANHEEIARFMDKIAEQKKMIADLQASLDEHEELAYQKTQFEEWENSIRDEIDDKQKELTRCQEQLTVQRKEFIKERAAFDIREVAANEIDSKIDASESRLMLLLRTMKEQEEKWTSSIKDLQRREDLADDWQRNHKQKEKKALEVQADIKRQNDELTKRTADVVAEEQKLKLFQKEMNEREQKLQVSLNRVANSEATTAAMEEKLKDLEASLKKRELESDMREREISLRRKELDNFEILYKEKERKIFQEQHAQDDREV